MCDSIANGGPRTSAAQQCCPPANVIIASNVLDTTGNVIAGNIISVDGTFTGNLYVAGNIVSNISYTSLNVTGPINGTSIWGTTFFGNGSGLSSLNASNLTGTISNTNLPPSGVTAGTYGSSANVSQVTVDQYGRVTAASNVGILSSQWTTVAGNVAYQNGVSIGSLSAPPIGSNLYVLGSANITDTLNVTTLYVNSAIVYGSATLNVFGISNLNSVRASLYIGNGSGLSNLNSSNLIGNVAAANVASSVTNPSQPNITSVGTLTGLTVNGLLVASNGSGISNINSSNLVGNVAAANVATSVTNPSQPNITSVGTLTSLNVSGISNLNSLVSGLISGNGSGISNINSSNLVGNVAAANVATSVTNPSQPNITSVGTLTGLTINGLLVASNGSAISNINSSNLVGNVAAANVASSVTNPSQPNITSVGTLTGLTVNGLLVASNGSGISNLNASNVIGTVGTAQSVTVASQPNITSVGSLTGLYSTGNVTASFFVGGGNALSNIQVANLTGTVNFANTAGSVTNPAQPNITSVGTLTSLSITGSLIAGTISGDGQGLYGIHANAISETVATANSVVQAAHPNITSVGTLTGLTVSGLLVASNGSGISNINSSNLTGTIPVGTLPTSGVTAGLYGSGANVSSVTVDQYGRITNASNIAITASQWTSATGNTIYYANAVGIGATTVPSATLMVTGNAYVSNSVTTTNIFFTNTIQATNLPTTGVTAGGYGSTANIPQIAVDQYGRLTSASNVAFTATSQWTTVSANVAFGNGVSIGTLSNPPVGSNLYVLGTANIDAINTSSLFVATANVTTGNVATLIVRTQANLVSANVTTGNIATANITTENVVTSNITTANVTNLRVQTLANLVSANVTTINIATANITTDNVVTANITTANVTNLRVQTLANLVSANVTTINIATANITTDNVVTANITTANVTNLTVRTQANLVSANVITGNIATANITAENVTTLNVQSDLTVSGALTSNSTNTTLYFDTLVIPYMNITTTANISGLNVVGTTNLTTLNGLTANLTSIFATNSNLLTANITTGNILTLNGVSIFGTNSNLVTANIGTENVATLNALSIFGTNSNLVTANIGTENVATLNALSIFGTNSNLVTANIGTENVATLNALSIFGTNSNLVTANIGTGRFTSQMNALSANIVTANVGTLNVVNSNTTTSNILNLTTINDAFIGPVRVGRGANVVATDTVLGANVLLNDPGSFDTAIGYQAMKSAQPFVGYDTALGANTLQSDVGPGYNTAIGAATMVNSSPSNGQDVALGFSALQNDVGAGYNTSIGTYSMLNSTPGGGNDVAVGYYALSADGGPGYNTAIGGQSMQGANPGGGYDTAVGWQTLQNDTGSYNTALGANAGQGITGGDHNTALGAGAGPYSGSLSYTTAIGAGAVPTVSNVAVFPDLVNVGINTGAPRANLEVQGNVYVSNSVTVPNVFATNLNVGAVSNLTNLVVTSNILAGPSGNTYITGNLVVSGNVFSNLGMPLGSGGGYYFSLGSDIALQTPYTGALYGTTYPLSVGLSNGFSISGTSTLITVTANGNFKFSVAGPYLLRGVFNSTDNITGLAVGSNVADVHGTDQGYLYRYTTFITQNPTEVIEIPFNVTDTTKYYYLDLFSTDGGVLRQTANTSGGTYLTITPLQGGGLATGGPGGTPGTQWINSGSNIYFSNSVGIGAINPAYKLDVSGDLRVTGNIYGNIIGTTLVSVATGLTSNYVANIGDYYIGVNGARQVTLPLGSSISAGKSYVIKDEAGNASVFSVLLQASGSDLIDGNSNVTMALNNISLTTLWTGTRWSLI